MLILGSCLALNLSYSGCCLMSLSSVCENKGCYCDHACYIWNDCCSDIFNIGCHPATSSIPISFSSSFTGSIVTTTPTPKGK